MKSVKKLGILAQYSNHELLCYTNAKMFSWFDDDGNLINYKSIKKIQTNLLLISNKNLISKIIIKAWLTCAFDKDCIAPAGSKYDDCCGCHRYDHSAITIISTYFYGHPMSFDKGYLPAYALQESEKFFITETCYFKVKYFDAMDIAQQEAIKASAKKGFIAKVFLYIFFKLFGIQNDA